MRGLEETSNNADVPQHTEQADSRKLSAALLAQGPRPFVLVRHTDVSGVSGTGVVAQGVEFADGTVALRWLSDWPTSVVFHDRGMDAVRAVHGHSGATEIRYTDQEASHG